jgi:hypothetical protein
VSFLLRIQKNYPGNCTCLSALSAEEEGGPGGIGEWVQYTVQWVGSIIELELKYSGNGTSLKTNLNRTGRTDRFL